MASGCETFLARPTVWPQYMRNRRQRNKHFVAKCQTFKLDYSLSVGPQIWSIPTYTRRPTIHQRHTDKRSNGRVIKKQKPTTLL